MIEHFRLGLVELALTVVRTVQPAFADVLDGQIESVISSVDRQPDVADQRRIHSDLPEELVAQKVFQIGGVGIDVIQIELVQTVIALALVVFSKIDFEAVAVTVCVSGHGGEAGVALCGKRDLLHRLAVDDHGRVVFCLIRRVGPKIRPVFIGDRHVHAVDPAGIEQAVVDRGIAGFTAAPGNPGSFPLRILAGRVFLRVRCAGSQRQDENEHEQQTEAATRDRMHKESLPNRSI